MKNNVAFNKILNIDNKNILLHKIELESYLLNGKNGRITLEVDMTLACNHKCPKCTFKNLKNKKSLISHQILKILTNNFKTIGYKGVIITGGGEPCLHPELGSFVKKLSDIGADVTLTTNGQLIDRHFKQLMHGLKRMRFSIDAATHKSFSLTHGVSNSSFKKVIENLKKAVEYKKINKLPIDIGVSFLICDENVAEIALAVETYKKIGVNFLHFKPMQYWDEIKKIYYHKEYNGVEELLLKANSTKNNVFRVSFSREKYYKKSNFMNVPYSKCHGSHFDMVIGADGKAYTCCHFKYDKNFCYGDLEKDDISKIMKNVKSKTTKNCFRDCKMDSLNQFIEYVLQDKEKILNLCSLTKEGDLPIGTKWL